MSRNTVGVAFILLSSVAWVAFFSGARILGATRASMLTLVAWLIFGETFSALQWVGFATVLLSLLMFEILAHAD